MPNEIGTVITKFFYKDITQGEIERYNLILVDEDYTRAHKADYQETFPHVPKLKNKRINISLEIS